MNTELQLAGDDYQEPIEHVEYDFGLNRRSFVQFLSTGLLILANAAPALGQRREGGRGQRRISNVGARIHLGKDGSITVLTGKVEAGQGARAELTMAAAEELCVLPGAIQLLMADTALVPDDGITAGSRSTPSTVPAVRQAAATARNMLVQFAAKTWNVDSKGLQVRDGKVLQPGSEKSLGYGDLAVNEEALGEFSKSTPSADGLTARTDWKNLGKPLARPNGRDIVTGKHVYPSDIVRPGMLYGKVLRAPSFGAKLVSIDPAPAKALKDVIVVEDDSFTGVAAPTTAIAEQALDALSKTAKWDVSPHPASSALYDYLKEHAQGGVPPNPFSEETGHAKQVLKQTYKVAYAQHAPLEPRAAVAEWSDEGLTVWTGTQNPFGCRGELSRAFHVPEERVRVVVPDFGAGYGGKHSGEAGIEAARLAKAAGRPVSLRWTRAEEFTWAYFRPAALIEIEASLDERGKLTSWHFININSGGSAIDTPYNAGKARSRFVNSDAPLRQGSYRGLAATANNFARECFMDELASAAAADPLDFRLAHLQNPRLRAVLETAAQRFNWKDCVRKKSPNGGVGLACGTEKGSYVAACAEITIENGTISVRRVCAVFECGAILNPANLHSQVQGALIMGLGPALREQVQFENGTITTASFRKYPVPRFADVPEFDIHLLDRPDLESAGAGETPIIAIAPAIANAVFHATGKRIRQMPIQLSEV
ncbi:MAG TPA: molybdopterin cofactor-binding domain-containing protein [Verrucomicrobiae bacterium]|nr:molybdopterin cofactor-binding domain-containing protein [Verrucomicrobiae bacterium]